MTPALQALVRDALERECVGLSLRTLRRASQSLSALYREADTGARTARRLGDAERDAYVVARLPATVVAAGSVFREAQARTNDVPVATLLDLGTGPGTSLWAAAETWPGLARAVLVDRDAGMLDIGRRLWRHHPSANRLDADWRRLDLATDPLPEPEDLVVLSYVIGELESGRVRALVARAAQLTRRILVVVEPGTPRGFRRIREAIACALGQGLALLAPCPHQDACPLQGDDDWCHFTARVARSPAHRRIKGAEVGWEDEKFSYAILGRPPLAGDTRPRIIRHPHKDKSGVRLRLCTTEGITDVRVTRADAAYRVARHARWGQIWSPVTHEPEA